MEGVTAWRIRMVAAAAGVLGSLVEPSVAHAQVQPDPDPEIVTPPPDPGLSGPYVGYASTPVLADETRACSLRTPVCVHASRAPRARADRVVLDVLAASERAWETLGGALRLPSPDVDPDDLRYHVYLVDGASELGLTQVKARDVRSRLDRARAFTVLDASVRAGCALDALAARELARAALFRVSPATAEGIARAQTTYLSQLMVPCALGLGLDATQTFQTRPDRAVCDPRSSSNDDASADDPRVVDPLARLFQAGASAFWSRIDWAFGRSPFAIVMATWALSPTATDVGAQRWHDEPDAFDVLRVSFKGALSTGSTLDDLLLDSAVARAFMGSADDGLHQVESRTLGDAARVTLDWDIPWPARPKRVAPRAPVFPTGSSYLVIRHQGAPPGARLRVEIAWEEHALFRWTMVKLDARGRELGRVGIPVRERATEAQMTLVDLEQVDRIVLVGTNVGDPAYRFDPDDEVWEPHGWLVTLASE